MTLETDQRPESQACLDLAEVRPILLEDHWVTFTSGSHEDIRIAERLELQFGKSRLGPVWFELGRSCHSENVGSVDGAFCGLLT